MTPEAKREIVARIKAISSLRIPEYELPADSFIEELAEDLYRIVLEHLP